MSTSSLVSEIRPPCRPEHVTLGEVEPDFGSLTRLSIASRPAVDAGNHTGKVVYAIGCCPSGMREPERAVPIVRSNRVASPDEALSRDLVGRHASEGQCVCPAPCSHEANERQSGCPVLSGSAAHQVLKKVASAAMIGCQNAFSKTVYHAPSLMSRKIAALKPFLPPVGRRPRRRPAPPSGPGPQRRPAAGSP